MERWRFSLNLQTTRRFVLESAPPFADIAREIADSMRVLCIHPDTCDEAPGYTRLVACVEIGRPLFDLFFNAATGYRGAYFSSPETGLRANAYFLDLLTPALATYEPHADLSQRLAEASLRTGSAKAWLAEVGKGFCARCEGEWTTPQDDEPDILNDRWDISTEARARYGRKAPLLTKLRVIGGFVDGLGGEYVTTRKRDRASQIHSYGWS
jgi:hypothetical protein